MYIFNLLKGEYNPKPLPSYSKFPANFCVGASQNKIYVGVSQNYGYLFRGLHNKDYSILGSILGLPYYGKLPCSSVEGPVV